MRRRPTSLLLLAGCALGIAGAPAARAQAPAAPWWWRAPVSHAGSAHDHAHRAAPDSAGAPCLPADSAQGAARYTIVMAGARTAGCQLVWRTGTRAWRSFYAYNDRGRGPRLVEEATLDAAGAPERVTVVGTDYLKVPVEERFERANGRARWKTRAEDDSAAIGSGAAPVYLPMFGTPASAGALAGAALRAGPRGVALLPGGRASATRVRDTVLASATGERTRITLVALDGLGFQAEPLWLDADGALFAMGSSWSMVVREGYEGAVGALDAAQRAWRDARNRRLAGRLARPAAAEGTPGVLVVRRARVFDPATLAARAGMTVVVRNGRVARLAPDDAVTAPRGATVIDAAGRTLLPGLWDMHVHASAEDGIFHLAAGVTTVRDMGNDWLLPDVARRWGRGTALGPRLLMSGIIDGPGPYTVPTGTVAKDAAEALAAVDRYADSGYVQIKLYSSLDTALVAPVARRAHARGLRLSGHVPQGLTAEGFVRAGADELQHANFLFLNFLGDSAGDTRTPARFTSVARHGASLGVGSDSVRRFVALLEERGTTVDPTLGVFEGMLTGRPGVVSPLWAPVDRRLPPQVRRELRSGGGLPVPEGMDARYRAALDSMRAFVRVLHAAGVPIVAGTDGAPGFALHRELELYEAAGIPAPEVLRLATLGAARVMKRDRELGRVAPGMLADFVLVDGDPLARVGDVRRTWLVVKGGVLYRPGELLAAVNVR